MLKVNKYQSIVTNSINIIIKSLSANYLNLLFTCLFILCGFSLRNSVQSVNIVFKHTSCIFDISIKNTNRKSICFSYFKFLRFKTSLSQFILQIIYSFCFFSGCVLNSNFKLHMNELYLLVKIQYINVYCEMLISSMSTISN